MIRMNLLPAIFNRLFFLTVIFFPFVAPMAGDQYEPIPLLEISYTFETIDFPGAKDTSLYGVNDAGVFVGMYNMGGTNHPFSLRHGHFSTYNIPGFGGGHFGVSNSRSMVGYATLSDGIRYGYVLSKKDLIFFDYPDATHTTAYGMNDKGEIVGAFLISGESGSHGFVYRNGDFSRLDVPGAYYSTIPLDINNSGDIVGFYEYWDDELEEQIERGFLFSRGEFIFIDCPGADQIQTQLWGINDHGQIIGQCSPHPYIGNEDFLSFIFIDGEFQAIRAPYQTQYTRVFDINNKGIIVGDYVADGTYHGFIAVPNH